MLQQYHHGDDVLLFQSLSGLVFEQLAARVERIAKEFLTAEREALGLAGPAWRYALSQDLKDKLLKTVPDDCIVELLEAHAREVSGVDVRTAARPRGSGGAPVAMHERHDELLALHKDGRGVVGYLLKLPFSEELLGQEQNDGRAGAVEVRLAVSLAGVAAAKQRHHAARLCAACTAIADDHEGNSASRQWLSFH